MGTSGAAAVRELPKDARRSRRIRQTARTSDRTLGLFLEALRQGFAVKAACQAAGIGKRTAYDHRRKDPEFRQAWEEALEHGVSLIEDALLRRALGGDTRAGIFLLQHRKSWLSRMDEPVSPPAIDEAKLAALPGAGPQVPGGLRAPCAPTRAPGGRRGARQGLAGGGQEEPGPLRGGSPAWSRPSFAEGATRGALRARGSPYPSQGSRAFCGPGPPP